MLKKCVLYKPYRFNYPKGIAIDSKNNIYIVDCGSKCIRKYNSEGQELLKWSEKYSCLNSIAVDKNDRIYVTDARGIKVYTEYGEYLNEFRDSGHGDGEFDCIHDVCVDDNGLMYIVDALNHRIQVLDDNMFR